MARRTDPVEGRVRVCAGRKRYFSHTSSTALLAFGSALALGVAAPGAASAAAVTVTPVQTTTYNLTAGANPITFGSGTDINTSDYSAVQGDNSASWTVTNLGDFQAQYYGVLLDSQSSVTNAGSITGTDASSDGVFLGAGGAVTNQTGGTISGGKAGVYVYDGSVTVTNAGSITGTGSNSAGIGVFVGGTVTNLSGGTISGDKYGVYASGYGYYGYGGPLTVTNAGSITATGAFGVGVFLGDGAVTNSGTISGGAVGVYIGGDSGAVTNQSGGTILGGYEGVYIGGDSGSVTNAGTISGTTASVEFGGSGANTLTLQTGSTLVGDAIGSTASGATNALVLQGSGTANNNFLNFNTLNVQASGAWTLGGVSTIGATTVASGKLIVTGALTSAFTINSGGTLQGNTASLLAQGGVTDNGTLVFDQASNGTFANAITGSGALIKQNTGALTLSGASSVGSTTVSGGSLIVTGPLTSAFTIDSGGTLQGNTASLLAQGGVTDNGTLVFDQASDGTFANAITGSGALIKQNAGLLVLNGVSAIPSTTVAGGNLRIGDAAHPTAQLTSAVTVQAGATLSGHGAVAGPVTNNGGTVSPGGSIGTLTINGDFTQTSNGALSLEMNPQTSSKLAVTGTAHLAGSVVLVSAPGNYRKGRTYTFLTAGSVTGAFSAVTATGGLQLGGANLLTGTATLLNGSFTNVGGTRNQTAVGAGLVSVPVGAADFDVVADALLGLPSAAQQNAALGELGGEIDADFLTVGRDSTRSLLSEISDQLSAGRDAYGGGGRDPWGRAHGRFGKVDGDGNAHGFVSTSFGAVVGATRDRGPNASFGAALSYGHTDLSLRGLRQRGDFDAFAAAVYGEERLGVFFLDAAGSIAYNRGQSTRSILFPGVTRRATGGFDGYAAGVLAAAGVRVDAGHGLRFEPSLAVTYSHVRQGGFTESGSGGADLAVNAKSQNALESIVQNKISKSTTLADGNVLRTDVRVAWTHEWTSASTKITETFAAPGGDPFTLAGANPGKDAGVFGAGLAYESSKRLTYYARYQATVGQNLTDNFVTAGFKWSW